MNGIDFIELKTVDATTLYVHFLNAVNVNVPGIGHDQRRRPHQRHHRDPIQTGSDWSIDANGSPILALHRASPATFPPTRSR